MFCGFEGLSYQILCCVLGFGVVLGGALVLDCI